MCNEVSILAVREIPDIKDILHVDLFANALRDELLVYIESLGYARTYRTKTQNRDVNCHLLFLTFHYSLLRIMHLRTPASLEISLIMSSTVPYIDTVSMEIEMSARPLIGIF